MITARGLVGGAPLIRLSSAARHELATAARVETTNADERSEMIDELKRLGRWLDDDRGGWWLEYGGRPHVVALVARIAAGLALIAEEPKIRRAHIDGARVVVEHDQRTRSEYPRLARSEAPTARASPPPGGALWWPTRRATRPPTWRRSGSTDWPPSWRGRCPAPTAGSSCAGRRGAPSPGGIGVA